VGLEAATRAFPGREDEPARQQRVEQRIRLSERLSPPRRRCEVSASRRTASMTGVPVASPCAGTDDSWRRDRDDRVRESGMRGDDVWAIRR
jgi:hypothetical protein